MTLGALGTLYLTQIRVNSSYAVEILPALIVIGAGLGLVFSTSIAKATLDRRGGLAPQLLPPRSLAAGCPGPQDAGGRAGDPRSDPAGVRGRGARAHPERRAAWLTFVVVGAGPTGVEMAGQMGEIARDLRADFRSATHHRRPRSSCALGVTGEREVPEDLDAPRAIALPRLATRRDARGPPHRSLAGL